MTETSQLDVGERRLKHLHLKLSCQIQRLFLLNPKVELRRCDGLVTQHDGSIPTKVRNPPQDLTTFGGLRHGPRVAV